MDDRSELATGGFVTCTTLLEGLKDRENQTVWRNYVERYRPLIVRYAAKLGVAGEDAEDVAQSTLLEFSTAYRAGLYDRDRGRLSSWLFGIARNQIRTAIRQRPAATALTPDDAHVPAVEDRDLEALWEREWRDAILWECLKVIRREVKPDTVRAFELFALEERPAQEVARELDLSENAVFLAKRRVVQRIGELMPLIQDIW